MTTLLEQLKKDEGFSPKAYWDIKQWTYGYGTKAPGEGATISEEEASKELEKHATRAYNYFNIIFSGHVGKFNEVRKNAFINMVFNMGPGTKLKPEQGGLYSFVNTLNLIFNNEEVDWVRVSENLKKSKWYRQVGNRAKRIVKEIATGEIDG